MASFINAVTLDEILALNAKTKGGLEKLNNLKSIHMKGKINQMGMEMPMEMWTKKEKKVRIEVEVQGQKMVMGYDGTTAWWIMPLMGITAPQEMPESQKNDVLEQSESLDEPLLNHKKLGHKVEFLGEDEVEGTKVFKLKMTKKDGKVIEFFLDQETAIELKQVTYTTAEGREVKVESLMGDYKQVEGLLFPGQIDTFANGQPAAKIIFDFIEVNPQLDDSMFAMVPKTESTPVKDEK